MKRRTVLALCLCLTLAGTPVGVSAASDSLLVSNGRSTDSADRGRVRQIPYEKRRFLLPQRRRKQGYSGICSLF